MAESEDGHPLPPKRDRRKLPDRDTLYQLHVVGGLSVEEIARRYQTTRRAAWGAFQRAGVFRGRHKRPITPEDLATIRRLFDSGVTQTEIAATVERTQGVESQVIRRHGWTRPQLRMGRKPKRKGG